MLFELKTVDGENAPRTCGVIELNFLISSLLGETTRGDELCLSVYSGFHGDGVRNILLTTPSEELFLFLCPSDSDSGIVNLSFQMSISTYTKVYEYDGRYHLKHERNINWKEWRGDDPLKPYVEAGVVALSSLFKLHIADVQEWKESNLSSSTGVKR